MPRSPNQDGYTERLRNRNPDGSGNFNRSLPIDRNGNQRANNHLNNRDPGRDPGRNIDRFSPKTPTNRDTPQATKPGTPPGTERHGPNRNPDDRFRAKNNSPEDKERPHVIERRPPGVPPPPITPPNHPNKPAPPLPPNTGNPRHPFPGNPGGWTNRRGEHGNFHGYDPRWRIHNNWRVFNHGRPGDWAGAYPWDPFWGGYYYWGGAYHFWGGRYYYPYYGPSYYGWYDYDSTYESSKSEAASEDTSIPFFFPPNTPPLGTPPPEMVRLGYSETPPKSLIHVINEPFYAQLGTQLVRNSLHKDQEQRIQAYLERKRTELGLLQAKLAEFENLAPEAKRAALQNLAATQAPALAALDNEAEAIRTSLLHQGLAGLFRSSINWNAQRQWNMSNLGDVKEDTRQRMLFLVVRASVYYQDGLSTSQRRLAHEAAMELQIKAYAPAATGKEETLMFFSPEMAQIQIPSDLSPSLQAKFSAYNEAKRRLRAELVGAIEALDFPEKKVSAKTFAAIAEAQAPKFEALEVIADDIREEIIQTHSQLDPASRLGLPEELRARIKAFSTEKTLLKDKLLETYENLKEMVYPARLNMNTQPNETNPSQIDFTVAPRLGQSDERLRQMHKMLYDFNQERQEHFIALAAEQESLQSAIAAHIQTKGLTDKDPAALLDQCVSWARYRDYHTAVFEPGLSIEQRRLLFDGATEEMALPLPPRE
jgi:hypothetical protein